MPSVLLIEDDPLLAETVEAMLRRLGHEPTTACNGRRAVVRVAEGYQPRLVLTDLQMPEMDGLEVIRHFRIHMPEVPLVAMTGELDPGFLGMAERLGARGTLRKPFSIHELDRVLVRALGGQA